MNQPPNRKEKGMKKKWTTRQFAEMLNTMPQNLLIPASNVLKALAEFQVALDEHKKKKTKGDKIVNIRDFIK